jgi:nucleotide-binding universal stress UspA family protein
MKKLLVTTDFSGNSKAGIRFGIQLAEQLNYEVVFLHIIEIIKPTSWSNKRYRNFSESKKTEAGQKLIDFIAAVCRESGFKQGNFRYAVELDMDAKGRIIKHAKKIGASFICMSTHGAGRLQKLFGTTASALITTSPIPVIVVPKGSRVKPLTSLFYASDFAALPHELRLVESFAEHLNTKVMVYHYDYLLHVPENKAKLDRLVNKYKAPNISFRLQKQNVESPLSDHFRHDIAKAKPSLVVLFTKRNRTWFDRLVLPSETAEMAFHSKTPLLVFRKGKHVQRL